MPQHLTTVNYDHILLNYIVSIYYYRTIFKIVFGDRYHYGNPPLIVFLSSFSIMSYNILLYIIKVHNVRASMIKFKIVCVVHEKLTTRIYRK